MASVYEEDTTMKLRQGFAVAVMIAGIAACEPAAHPAAPLVATTVASPPASAAIPASPSTAAQASADRTTQWKGVPHALPANRDTVGELQQSLNQLGIHDAQGRRLRRDGDHSPRTRQAIESFQRRHGMPVDGKVTPQLLAATRIAASVNEAVYSAQWLGQRYGIPSDAIPGWPGVPHVAPAQPAVRRLEPASAAQAQFADVRSRVESTEALVSPQKERAAASPTIAEPDLDRATVETYQKPFGLPDAPARQSDGADRNTERRGTR